jgi:hypothetical protein
MSFLEERKRKKPVDEQSSYVMQFVEESREQKDDLEEIWDEVEENFLVRSPAEAEFRSTRHPLIDPTDRRQHFAQNFSTLKDPETHQQLMTLAAKLMLALFPEDSFVQTKAVGFEDTFKSSTANKLLQHAHSLPGHYSAMLEYVLSILAYGTGIVETFWDFVERPRTEQVPSVNPFTGEITFAPQTLIQTIWDDPRVRPVNVRDFFNDPGASSILESRGAAVRFRLTADEAMDRAENGLYRMADTKEAIRGFSSVPDEDEHRDRPRS